MLKFIAKYFDRFLRMPCFIDIGLCSYAVFLLSSYVSFLEPSVALSTVLFVSVFLIFKKMDRHLMIQRIREEFFTSPMCQNQKSTFDLSELSTLRTEAEVHKKEMEEQKKEKINNDQNK